MGTTRISVIFDFDPDIVLIRCRRRDIGWRVYKTEVNSKKGDRWKNYIAFIEISRKGKNSAKYNGKHERGLLYAMTCTENGPDGRHSIWNFYFGFSYILMFVLFVFQE